VTDTPEIVQWIHQLADPNPQNKSASALRLYLAGAALCTSLLKQWTVDPQFRELVLPRRAKEELGTEPDSAAIVVGIAVKPETFEKIHAANHSPRLVDVPPDQDAKEYELHFEDHIHFDILTSRELAGKGAIARFLEKFGEGIQQIEVYVRNVDRATEIMRSRFGLNPIYPATRAGADGTRVNFFLATTPQGNKVLIEFVEAQSN
jgi:hypothetical protein